MLLLRHVQQSFHHTIITFVGHVAVEVLDPTLVALADDEDHVETIVGMRLLDGALDGLHTIDDHRGIHMVVGDMPSISLQMSIYGSVSVSSAVNTKRAMRSCAASTIS